MTEPASRPHLVPRRVLEELGLDSRAITLELEGGRLERVHRGWYERTQADRRQFPEVAHRARTLAVGQSMRADGAAFSHLSAAVLWGLPVFRGSLRDVHTTLVSGRQSRSGGVVKRHRDALLPADVTTRDGMLCTSLERTVFDVARLCSRETAIACADAALRAVAWDAATWTYDEPAAAEWHERMRVRMAKSTGARGIRRSRLILPLADGRARLPGESVSRLYLWELGFAAPRLQVRIPGPHGADYFVDLGLDDVDVWGEFDGVAKYVDAALLGGRTSEEALLDEKRREDWIRGTTGRRVVRWGMSDLESAAALGARLRSFGIHPPR